MNKVLGAHDKCFCGTPVTCVEKEYQGNKRLSWVNEDGTSHYNRAEDGSFSCNSTVIEDPKNKRMETSPTTNNNTLIPPKDIPAVVRGFDDIYKLGIGKCEEIARRTPAKEEKDYCVRAHGLFHDFLKYYIHCQEANTIL